MAGTAFFADKGIATNSTNNMFNVFRRKTI